MVWRVRFQKRIGRSAAKADVTVAASTKTISAVLRMTLPCWHASFDRLALLAPRLMAPDFMVLPLLVRQPVLLRGRPDARFSLASTLDRVKMPNCGEFVRASLR